LQFHSPIVFCHNDLQEGNFIATEYEHHDQLSNNTTVSLDHHHNLYDPTLEVHLEMIDFEYSHYNYRGFDLANHMCEHYIDYSTPHFPFFTLKHELFPDHLYMKQYFRYYLTYFDQFKQKSCQTIDHHQASPSVPNIMESEVEALEQETLSFMLASHMMWSIWGILQSTLSCLSFGYLEYARQRLQEYDRLKEILIRMQDKQSSIRNKHEPIQDGSTYEHPKAPKFLTS